VGIDPDVPGIERLREVLAGHGFLGDEVRQALGVRLGPAHLRRDLPVYLRRLAAPRPLHTAIKLFLLGLWLDPDEVAAAVRPVPVDALLTAGLLESGPRGLRCPVELCVHRDVLLAFDRYLPERGPEPAPDHVLGSNNPALLLDALTVRLPVKATLDLGCGGGVQSFLAARHSERVVAVDKNPRALLFFRLNARLNGIPNLEPLEGDLFSPVAGRRFGLLVCNPPYVISPESRHIFMESGRPGDSICEEAVRRAGEHLEEGGFATILCNWALRAGEEWSAPLRRWVDGNGCDAWLLRGDLQDPLSYAAAWNRERSSALYEGALDRWTAYYRDSGIESMGLGAVILRRRKSGTPFVRADVLPADPDEPCHEQILRIFAAEDFLSRSGSDEELLATPLRLTEDHRLRHSLRVREGQWMIEQAEIELQGEFRFKGTVDPIALGFLSRCDGRATAKEALSDFLKGDGPEAAGRRAAGAAAVRRLVAQGFLIPPGTSEGK
jgi:methylase of polypeptide subunit release factors